MRAIDHFQRGERALAEACQAAEDHHFGRVIAKVEIAKAEFAAAQAAAVLGGPHRDPNLDAEPLPHSAARP